MKRAAKITFIWQRTLMIIVFLIGVLGMIFNDDQSAKSEYLFIGVQSGLFLIVSLVPAILNKMEIDVPDFVYIFFICFCLAHFFCGEILGFFVRFKWWDSVLHTFSGMMLALLSFSLVSLLNKNDGNFKLSMGFAILFAFSLAIAIGVIWEIIEFASDSWFGSNMQRAYVSTFDGRGEPFVGQRAVLDTMKDLILDALGAGIVCVTCAIFAHKKKIKVEDLSFIKRRVKVAPATDTNTDSIKVLTYDSVVEEVNTEENLIAKELIKLEEKSKIDENDEDALNSSILKDAVVEEKPNNQRANSKTKDETQSKSKTQPKAKTKSTSKKKK